MGISIDYNEAKPLYHMDKTLIVANWKSNMTKSEAKTWLEDFSSFEFPQNIQALILPPFTLLDFVYSFVSEHSLPFKLGAQNISEFNQGAYTGEIAASQIKEFAQYVLIGHSERKQNFGETTDVIKRKAEKALANSLIPIVCITNFDEAREMELGHEIIFAYEPLGAIGTGNPEDPEIVRDFAEKFTATFQNHLIYGGSINKENIKKYLNIPGISGVLVGSESLLASSFSDVIKNA